MGTPLTKTIPQNTSYIQNGIRVDTNNISNNMGFGVPQPTLCLYNVVPLTAIPDLICASQAPASGTAMTLRANAVTTSVGGQGVTLDCNRAVSITFTTTGNTVASSCTATCTGYDDRGVLLTSNLTVPSTTSVTANTTKYTFPKMYSRVISVVWNTAPGQSVSVGTGATVNSIQAITAAALGIATVTNGPTGVDAFGLPFFCPLQQYILRATWGSTTGVTNASPPVYPALWKIDPFLYLMPSATTAGTPIPPTASPGSNSTSASLITGGFVPGYQMNPLGATGGPALPGLTSRDARGYIFVPSAGATGNANGPVNLAPTGTQLYGQPAFSTSDARYTATGFAGYNMLSVLFYAYGADSYVQGQLTNGNASAQMQTLIFGPTNPSIGYGSTTPSAQPSQLLAKDEVGLQNSTPGV